jgi:hypothetical protein
VFGYHFEELKAFTQAWMNTWTGADENTVDRYISQLAESLRDFAVELPDAMCDIAGEFGFHFDSGQYREVFRTDRMDLCQVLPDAPGVVVRDDCEPVLFHLGLDRALSEKKA